MEELPEGCMAHILSYTTTPVEAIRFSLVSKAFRSAAEYDILWDRFVPSDLSSIIPPSSFPSSNSKKDLYFALCDRPTIIDQGKRSFQLEKRTGNKCYMLSARNLYIVWGESHQSMAQQTFDTCEYLFKAPPPGEISQYWEWTSMADSRFEEVARLYAVCWFEISGTINTRVLSPNTHYAAFLVFKMIDASGFHHAPVALSVGIIGGSSTCRHVCLDPNLEDDELDERFWGLQRPNMRSDGWLEIEMGEFFNSGLEEDELQMKVMETGSNMWKHGFFLQGIEVRPKQIKHVLKLIKYNPIHSKHVSGGEGLHNIDVEGEVGLAVLGSKGGEDANGEGTLLLALDLPQGSHQVKLYEAREGVQLQVLRVGLVEAF
ncbi:hypothetical protein Fmac_024346 [Flemingia macrophylla]|uniref:F-box domain-containing protein n=1 Tax=Flemingia macrophylla TaxID=520843 RepID=A0ABD1LP30_9FABA